VKPIPLREVAALGLVRLKVSAVVPFNGTLAAPKTFAIVGGNLAGGGGVPDPDEPPPQAAVHSKLRATPRNSGMERTLIRNL
jgi:hypothetical protein